MKPALRVAAVVLIVALGAGLVFFENPLWVNDQNIRFHLWRAHVSGKYVEAGGYRLHYFEAKPTDGTDGTPLVLIHGLGSRGEDWAALMPNLAARGFHVYAPDLLGYGRSPRPDVNYSISLQEATVVQFLQAVHVAHADIGGWSMGGWVSMKLALDYPELVDRLVVYDSAGVYFPATFDATLFVPADAAGVRHLMAMLSPKPAALPDFAAEAALRKLQSNGWVINRSVASMQSGRDLLDFRLHNIKRPTLVVWGSADELIPLSVGESIHAGIPGSVMNVMEGCGHLAPAECWKPVLDATVTFLKAEPAISGGEKVFPVEK
jgi:pimeloyl-ACP methyl ester carboxylesterase